MRKAILIAVLTLGAPAAVSIAGETTFYTLDNGMQVILKESHAAPLISSVIIVKAGSKFESEKNNGFTHLLEHMLFNGTETRTREQIEDGINDYGGYINAFTRQEMTGYLVVMPSEFIEQGLDIQSDQLFNSILPADQFPKERDIVVEEIKKDNDVAGNIAYDYFNSVKFAGTPYARPVIGYEETIRKVSRDEVMAYYKKYYVPNNMTAFISGDFEIPEMKRLIQKYYGSVPRGPEPEFTEFEVSPNYDSEIHIKKYPSDVTYIDIALPGPPCGDEGFYAFDFLAQYLDSDASPLSKALLKGEDPITTMVSVGLDVQSEFTMMDISIRADDTANIEKIAQTTLNILKKTARNEFSDSDIKRVVIPNRVDEIKLEEKLHYYGIIKAPYLATCGYEFVENYVKKLSKVTTADISTVAGKYLADPEYIVTALAPEGGK
jgi:zinc protease